MEEEEQEPPSLHELLNITAESRHLSPPDLTSTTSLNYLDHLVSLSLASLTKEPTLISAEAASVESELVNLCYREYNTFLSVHHCSSAVRSAFDDFQDSLDHLLGSVPALEEQCGTFTRNAHQLSANRNRSILVQEHQDKLLDLLELPQLMETCVRNGYYQEAMELAAHSKDLRARYPETRLVADVAKEVDSVIQLLLAQLLHLLREPVKLSTALRTINYLRRLDVMDESSLGLAFLGGRLHNFRHQLLQIEKDRADPVRYVRKYIDFFREHVYDIISQYTAVFDDHNALVSFAGQCVTDLVQLVARYVPRIANDPASLSSVLIQLGYCSLSFARIGLDFSHLIVSPFAETMMATYRRTISLASEKLHATLKAANKGQNIPTDAIIDSDQRSLLLATASSAMSTDSLSAVSPFPPLGVFVNEHLTALNALRLLAPVHLAPQFMELLGASLKDTTRAVLQFVREAEATTNNDSRPAKHSRTASSPRAHLLRRNTETQLSPSARSAKRRESQQICLRFCLVWRQIVHYMLESLGNEVFGRSPGDHAGLQEAIRELDSWIDQHRDSDTGDAGQPNGESQPNGEVGTLRKTDEADSTVLPVQEKSEGSSPGTAPTDIPVPSDFVPEDPSIIMGEGTSDVAVDRSEQEQATYPTATTARDVAASDDDISRRRPSTAPDASTEVGGNILVAQPEQEPLQHRELEHEGTASQDLTPRNLAQTTTHTNLDASQQTLVSSSSVMEPMFAGLPTDSNVDSFVSSADPDRSVVVPLIPAPGNKIDPHEAAPATGVPPPELDSRSMDQSESEAPLVAAKFDNVDGVEPVARQPCKDENPMIEHDVETKKEAITENGANQQVATEQVATEQVAAEQVATEQVAGEEVEDEQVGKEQIESLGPSSAQEAQGSGQKKKKKKKKKKN
ncbi:Dor1-like family-domain-containing protein [Papiliotrema laurentii]|uniref:Conserved oligomeric Golgi complex subunit 8 n=1 Tax=Papiliotrema laurentii TaxID=5418 RepID=A0AAD9CUJ5_PAPLA|nr:Dor1-like family-domain-containing protein [Papiliotrema laurentii]